MEKRGVYFKQRTSSTLLGDLVALDLLEQLLGLSVVLKVVTHGLQDLVEVPRQRRLQVRWRGEGKTTGRVRE